MMETQVPYKTETPKVDVLHLLLDIFTISQLIKFAAACKATRTLGYGDVTIHFKGGRPRLIIRSESQELE